MAEKITYQNNKINNIHFLQKWIEQLYLKNKDNDFIDDYHIDEIDKKLYKKTDLWIEAIFKIFSDFHVYINEKHQEINIMLCFPLKNTNVNDDIPQKIDKSTLNINEPPSIYLFNKGNIDICNLIKSCIKIDLKYINENGMCAYYKEIIEEDGYIYRFVFTLSDKVAV